MTDICAVNDPTVGYQSMDSDEFTRTGMTKRKHAKLSVVLAAVMIAGTTAGSGILALPSAVEATGWIGCILIIYLGLLAGYTGVLLGWSWDIVDERYSHEIEVHNQDPYPLLGEKAFGKRGRIVVKICIYISICGGCIVFLLLASDLCANLILVLGKQDFSLCFIVLIFGGALIPCSWLGTPVDFWPMGVAALMSTMAACFCVIGYTAYLRNDSPDVVLHPPVQVEKFFMSMGSILFTLSGHPSFPTIQQDMSNRKHFSKATILSFVVVITMYLMITITSYIMLGGLVGPNILTTLSNIEPGWPVTLSEILLITHLITGLLVVINPINQDLEHVFKIPNKFCLGRVIVRTCVIAFLMFVAETVPRFAVILSLIGGSAITMITFILPVSMYESLCRQKGPWPTRHVPYHLTALHVEILVIGVLVIVTSTYAGIKEIIGPDTFVPPCYVNISAVHL